MTATLTRRLSSRLLDIVAADDAVAPDSTRTDHAKKSLACEVEHRAATMPSERLRPGRSSPGRASRADRTERAANSVSRAFEDEAPPRASGVANASVDPAQKENEICNFGEIHRFPGRRASRVDECVSISDNYHRSGSARSEHARFLVSYMPLARMARYGSFFNAAALTAQVGLPTKEQLFLDD